MKILLLGLVLCGACVSADFHSKTGQTFPVVTHRAVIVDANELGPVMAAGAVLIGTISAEGMARNTDEDVTDRAAEVAAENGGTHVILTSSDEDVTTYDHPARFTKDCSNDGYGNHSCERSFHPAYETEVSRPTGEYRVLRVPVQNWGALPDTLRPGLGGR